MPCVASDAVQRHHQPFSQIVGGLYSGHRHLHSQPAAAAEWLSCLEPQANLRLQNWMSEVSSFFLAPANTFVAMTLCARL